MSLQTLNLQIIKVLYVYICCSVVKLYPTLWETTEATYHMCLLNIYIYSCWFTNLRPTFCYPIVCSPSSSSVHGISQARILEWVAIIFSRGSSQSRDQTHIFCIGRWVLFHWATMEVHIHVWKNGKVLVAQSSPTLWNSVDYSLPGSSVPGVLHARVLEWVAILFLRGSSWLKDQTCVSCTASRFFTIWATREAPYICIYIYNVYRCIVTHMHIIH